MKKNAIIGLSIATVVSATIAITAPIILSVQLKNQRDNSAIGLELNEQKVTSFTNSIQNISTLSGLNSLLSNPNQQPSLIELFVHQETIKSVSAIAELNSETNKWDIKLFPSFNDGFSSNEEFVMFSIDAKVVNVSTSVNTSTAANLLRTISTENNINNLDTLNAFLALQTPTTLKNLIVINLPPEFFNVSALAVANTAANSAQFPWKIVLNPIYDLSIAPPQNPLEILVPIKTTTVTPTLHQVNATAFKRILSGENGFNKDQVTELNTWLTNDAQATLLKGLINVDFAGSLASVSATAVLASNTTWTISLTPSYLNGFVGAQGSSPIIIDNIPVKNIIITGILDEASVDEFKGDFFNFYTIHETAAFQTALDEFDKTITKGLITPSIPAGFKEVTLSVRLVENANWTITLTPIGNPGYSFGSATFQIDNIPVHKISVDLITNDAKINAFRTQVGTYNVTQKTELDAFLVAPEQAVTLKALYSPDPANSLKSITATSVLVGSNWTINLVATFENGYQGENPAPLTVIPAKPINATSTLNDTNVNTFKTTITDMFDLNGSAAFNTWLDDEVQAQTLKALIDTNPASGLSKVTANAVLAGDITWTVELTLVYVDGYTGTPSNFVLTEIPVKTISTSLSVDSANMDAFRTQVGTYNVTQKTQLDAFLAAPEQAPTLRALINSAPVQGLESVSATSRLVGANWEINLTPKYTKGYSGQQTVFNQSGITAQPIVVGATIDRENLVALQASIASNESINDIQTLETWLKDPLQEGTLQRLVSVPESSLKNVTVRSVELAGSNWNVTLALEFEDGYQGTPSAIPFSVPVKTAN